MVDRSHHLLPPGVYQTSDAGPFCGKYAQILSEKDTGGNEKKEKVDLTAGTPQLPECTGMNGDRKGKDADCRQIGRFNGPWPVTDDL